MTSFHHQSEAQHPKSSAIHKYAGRLPHLMTQSRHCLTAEAEAKRPDDRLIELVVGSSVIGNDLEAAR